VRLAEELLSIPNRIYFDLPVLQTAQLTEQQSELLDCLLTRGITMASCVKSILHESFVRKISGFRVLSCRWLGNMSSRYSRSFRRICLVSTLQLTRTLSAQIPNFWR
jgi:hypothetical protein